MARRFYTRVLITGLALAALGSGIAAAASSGDSSSSVPAPAVASVFPVEGAVTAAQITGYTNAVTLNQTKAWDEAMFVHGLELLAYYYVPPPPPPKPAAMPQAKPAAPTGRGGSSGGATGACGGATNGADVVIGAESGGNPNARNASGAWGCYQIMPGTWSGSCSDLGSYGSAPADAQAKCASRLPKSAWTATWH